MPHLAWNLIDNFKLDNESKKWLCNRNSLTAELRKYCKEPLDFLITNHYQSHEQKPVFSNNFYREIIFCCAGLNYIYARSFFSPSLLKSNIFKNEELISSDIINKPLGEVLLFNDNAWQRGEFEFARIDCEYHEYQWFINYLTTENQQKSVFARRSTFYNAPHYIQIIEVFLPDNPWVQAHD